MIGDPYSYVMGKSLTIVVEDVREYAAPWAAYSRRSAITEALLARKAYEHCREPEPVYLDRKV